MTKTIAQMPKFEVKFPKTMRGADLRISLNECFPGGFTIIKFSKGRVIVASLDKPRPVKKLNVKSTNRLTLS